MSNRRENYLPDGQRAAPVSLEAERALLGSILLFPGELFGTDRLHGFSEGTFYFPAHQAIYRAALSLWADGKPVDLILLTQTLRNAGTLEAVGGPGYLTGLFSGIMSASSSGHYIEILREKKWLRDVIATGGELISRAYGEQDQIAKLRKDFEQFLFRFTNDDRKTKERPIKEIVFHVLDSLGDPERVFGISTGFPELDSIVGGLAGGAKVVIGGEISGGKSALAHNIGVSLAVRRKIPTAYFSFEMSDNQTAQRLIQTHAEVSVRDIAKNACDLFLVNRFKKAALEVAEAPLFIINERMDIAGIRARIMQLCASSGLRVAIIDYLQIVPEERQRGENETNQLDRMSRETKQIAHSTGITVIELSQLTKVGDSWRTRGSSGITADADQLWIIDGDDRDKELLIAKQRDGPKGKVRFRFAKEITKFYEGKDL